MIRDCSIAVAQICPIKGDVESNSEAHLGLVEIAASEGARLVLFPELSLTGYELEYAGELAFAEDDARLSALVQAASALSVTMIVGAPVRIGPKLHIGAFILAPTPPIELYTKHHLGAFSVSDVRDGIVPPAEAALFQAGDRNPLVHIGGETAAVARGDGAWRIARSTSASFSGGDRADVPVSATGRQQSARTSRV